MTIVQSSILVFAGLCLIACQGPVAPSTALSEETAIARPEAGTVEAVRDGATTLRPGQSLSVALPSNGSTGYFWSVAPFDETVLARGEPFGQERTDPHPAGMVGVGGQTHWRFTAAAPGETTLIFAYGGPWEKGTPPAETARYTITVR